MYQIIIIQKVSLIGEHVMWTRGIFLQATLWLFKYVIDEVRSAYEVIPYMQATNLSLGSMLLSFTAVGRCRTDGVFLLTMLPLADR